VVEVQKILDHQSALCTDVLSPGLPAFVLLDRASTSQLVRFTRLFAWITHYPYFSRLGGVGITVEFDIWPFWKAIWQKRLAREQAQQPGITLRELLAQNFFRAIDILTELGLDYRRRIFEGIDLHHCVATYRLAGTVYEVAAILQNKPDFEPEPPRTDTGFAKPLAQFSWLRRGESAKLDQTMIGAFKHPDPSVSVGTVGNVRLYCDKLIIEVFSKKKYDFARKMMDQFFGPLVRFEKDTVMDLAEMHMLKQPHVKVSPEVTEILDREFSGRHPHGIHMDVSREIAPENTTSVPAGTDQVGTVPNQETAIERMLQRQFQSLLDERIPMLGDHTPRECARDASLRPLLIEWMKGQIHHLETNRRRDGTRVNVDWILDELGLTELK